MSEETCPFCRNPVHPQAIVCGSCQAQKGYWQKADGKIYDEDDQQKMGIVFPALIGIVPAAVILLLSRDPAFHASTAVYVGLPIWVLFWIGVAFIGYRRLQQPMNWYRRKHNN